MKLATEETAGGAPAATGADSATTGPGAGPETPAGAAAETAAGQGSESTPARTDDQAPAAKATDSAPVGSTATDERVKHAQRLMHAATEKAATLQKRLDLLLGTPEAPARPGGEAATRTEVKETVRQAAAAEGIQLDDATLETLYDKWKNDPDDKSAFKLLMREAVSHAVTHARSSILQDPTLVDQTLQRLTARAQESQRLVALGDTIETFWKDVVPNASPEHLELFWSFADAAQRTHPRDVKQQALYCLERGLRLIDPITSRAADVTREQDAVTRAASAALPGGGASSAPGGGGGERLPTFVEQMKALRPRQPGEE